MRLGGKSENHQTCVLDAHVLRTGHIKPQTHEEEFWESARSDLDRYPVFGGVVQLFGYCANTAIHRTVLDALSH